MRWLLSNLKLKSDFFFFSFIQDHGHLFSPVFNCFHLFSPVFNCFHLFSFDSKNTNFETWKIYLFSTVFQLTTKLLKNLIDTLFYPRENSWTSNIYNTHWICLYKEIEINPWSSLKDSSTNTKKKLLVRQNLSKKNFPFLKSYSPPRGSRLWKSNFSLKRLTTLT